MLEEERPRASRSTPGERYRPRQQREQSRPGPAEDVSGEEIGRDEMVEALEGMIDVSSSNVHSIGCRRTGRNTCVLYVTYQAPMIAGEHITGRGPVGALIASKGAYGGRNSGRPGATYAYDDVPYRYWYGFRKAKSKGQWVWDNLRVRGSIDGHQYSYRLADPATIVQEDGVTGQYIPRLATAAGYMERRIRVPNSREVWHSTLPERRFRPDRGLPDRGTPDRGRA